MDVDVAVVGGGPAGSVVARCLAAWGRSVALLERSVYAEPRFGETLPPETMPLLASLGLGEALARVDSIASPGTVSRWGTRETVESEFVRNVHGPGLHVDRTGFDRALAGAAAASGAHLATGVALTGVSRCRDRWLLSTTLGPVTAGFVVDAAGRGGCGVARRRGVRGDRMLAVTVLLRNDHPPADLRTFIESTPRGWWYSAPVRSHEMIAMFFTDRVEYRRIDALDEELEESPLTLRRFEGADVVTRQVLPVHSVLREPVVGPGWLAAGDSAASYDPISGAGIHKALGQGALAADAVQRLLEGDVMAAQAYARRVRSEFDGYASTRSAAYTAERRWQGGFWDRRRSAQP